MNEREKYSAVEAVYREWNEKINVVSRKDVDKLYEHHILHSLAIAEYLRRFYPADVWDGAKVLDLGTGGGFPGIPLAMEYPSAKFTLCDSIGKKLTVARAVAEAAGLENVEIVNARAEDLSPTFDWVVTRAVATLDKLYPWVRGKFSRSLLALKGGDVNAEVSDLLRKYRLKPSAVRIWKISDWLQDEYFEEKFVIELGKDYLCPPNSGN